MAQRLDFVRVELGGRERKLRFKHKDLRDAVKAGGASIGEMFLDAFGGWAYLLLYGLRWRDESVTLDKCSEYIDQWADDHQAEEKPLASLGKVILEALKLSGFIKIDEIPNDADDAEGNAKPEASTPSTRSTTSGNGSTDSSTTV